MFIITSIDQQRTIENNIINCKYLLFLYTIIRLRYKKINVKRLFPSKNLKENVIFNNLLFIFIVSIIIRNNKYLQISTCLFIHRNNYNYKRVARSQFCPLLCVTI